MQEPSATGELPVEDSPPKGDIEPQLLPFPVVAIGGSAGGIEAYLEILRHLPPDTGMTFIILAHLAPTHKSHLPDILECGLPCR
jgi:two-component system CheB/CheR fusion protein